ncbi:hypothetical protein [Roseisolibacter sp. H3M3-2]|uniref:hypothetical protein n=1 Tax=Roseisolibacter sp. H3M3-2 TaxID=3031323 RepID=UPI0023DAC4B8|nr:hypothetical protein [Roseisolibacter sp. H3M3-2]MDF1505604.1 hypothetical protein [Roseisolibacter sp. H3M3-2]
MSPSPIARAAGAFALTLAAACGDAPTAVSEPRRLTPDQAIALAVLAEDARARLLPAEGAAPLAGALDALFAAARAGDAATADAAVLAVERALGGVEDRADRDALAFHMTALRAALVAPSAAGE